MFHLLPCLTTFNIVVYLNESELNKLGCGVLSICNSLHIELHLTCSIVCCTLPCHASLNRTCIILDCASCHDYACVFTMLFASFRFASLVSFGFVPELWGFVRLRPFVFFLDSFFFFAGSQARWPLPSISLLSLLASCSVLSLCCATYHLFTMPPILPCQPLTFSPFLANHWLVMLPLCSAPLIALLVAGEDWSLFLVGTWIFCWDITISLI